MSQDLAYLNQEQRESLADLPFAVLLPRSLPQGWKVESVVHDALDDGEGDTFVVTIGGFGKRCYFQTSNEGIGDPPPGDHHSTHHHPEFGEIRVEHEDSGSQMSDWLEVENGWSSVRGQGLTDAELDLMINLLELF